MITRAGQTIILDGPCTVEDAEALLGHIHAGADEIDITGCTFLHTACLQVLLAARETKIIGTPASAALAQWVAPFIQAPASTEI
jgi:hypothetical protein